MKFSVVLGGLFMLVVLTHASEDAAVACYESWLRVRIRRKCYVYHQQIQSHELSLGTGCPVTKVEQDFLEFFYLLSACGIRVYRQLQGTVVESMLTYHPTGLDITGYLPIFCVVPRSQLFTFVTKTSVHSPVLESLLRESNFTAYTQEDLRIHQGVSLDCDSSSPQTYTVLSGLPTSSGTNLCLLEKEAAFTNPGIMAS